MTRDASGPTEAVRACKSSGCGKMLRLQVAQDAEAERLTPDQRRARVRAAIGAFLDRRKSPSHLQDLAGRPERPRGRRQTWRAR